tara:strand:+ start:2859 stop:3149 length:291 start_codon:yes stop_codon:yes gene_type:complete
MANKTSPYFKTDIVEDYLDVIEMPAITQNNNDEYYTIESKFDRRPDLLANKLYGNPRLWWVFIKRNMNSFEDPINDFRTGKTIRIPNASSLTGLKT